MGFELNKERAREERYSEEQVQEVLIELCEQMAPKIANQARGYKKDAQMICNRIVNEHIGDMVDAASLGEDVATYCKENNVCPFGFGDLTNFFEALSKGEKIRQEGGTLDDDTAEEMRAAMD